MGRFDRYRDHFGRNTGVANTDVFQGNGQQPTPQPRWVNDEKLMGGSSCKIQLPATNGLLNQGREQPAVSV
jgi:hypothetical protein